MHKTTSRFWRCLDKIPKPAQQVVKKKFNLLKTNPLHPSLHFKKVGKFWSIRAGLNYRALAVREGEDFIWVWVGTHSEYDRMIKEMG